jgi:hypothetical protein
MRAALGECGLKGFITEFFVTAILNYRRVALSFETKTYISTEGLVKLPHDHEELHLAVLRLTRDTNSELQHSLE